MLVVIEAGALSLERGLQRLFAANEGVGGPDRRRLGALDVGPDEFRWALLRDFSKSGAGAGVPKMEPLVVG